MFGRRFEPAQTKSFSKTSKANKSSSSFSKTHGVSKSRHEPRQHRRPATATSSNVPNETALSPTGYVSSLTHFLCTSHILLIRHSLICSFSRTLTPSIVTLVIGKDQRIFAAHEDVLSASPWFQQALSDQYMDSQNSKRIHLPEEEPEIFSSVLEYLYKGDYYPRLIHNKRRNSWEIEQIQEEGQGSNESTVYHRGVDGDVLKDTVIYCTADRYGLEELKRVALRKQGLRK